VSDKTSGRRFLDCRGLVAIEFGMIAVILVTLLLGTVELGRYQFTLQSLRQITALSARQAMVNANTVMAQRAGGATASLISADALKTAVTTPNNPTPMLRPNLLTLTIGYSTLSGTDLVTVTAEYPFQFLAPLMPAGTITMRDVAALPY
jgi:Flp pilus assembly protein TadG